METVTLTIDGRSLTVEKGKTVLQAAAPGAEGSTRATTHARLAS